MPSPPDTNETSSRSIGPRSLAASRQQARFENAQRHKFRRKALKLAWSSLAKTWITRSRSARAALMRCPTPALRLLIRIDHFLGTLTEA